MFLLFFVLLNSCSPIIYSTHEESDTVKIDNNNTTEIKKQNKQIESNNKEETKKTDKATKLANFPNINLSKRISIILPKRNESNITNQFLQTIEIATYKKKNRKSLFQYKFI